MRNAEPMSGGAVRDLPEATVADRRTYTSWVRSVPLSWRAFGAWVAAYVMFTIVLSAVGLLIVNFWEGSSLHAAETRTSRWFEDQRTPTLDEVSHWISFSGDAVPKTIFIVVLAATFAAVWRRWLDSVFLAATMLLEVATFGTVSLIVGRNRPPVEQLDGSLPTSSFPSGHVAASFALYGAIAVIIAWHTRKPIIRWAMGAFAVIWPLLMVVIRLYRGMHYLSDVVFGTALGVASIVVAMRLVQVGIDDMLARQVPAEPPPRARKLDLSSEHSDVG